MWTLSVSLVTVKWVTNPRWTNCSQGSLTRKHRYATMQTREHELVLVLDFGAQYGQLIARRVREQNVFCQIVRHDLAADRVAALNPRGLILSGGPASVYGPNAPRCDPKVFDLGIPVLGICYGMQLVCHTLGGEVQPARSRE